MAVKLSREEQYGIMALVDLAYNSGSGPAQVRQIAKRHKIPQRFLEQIFAKLRQAKVVNGKRGPRGGYVLARNADEIQLEDIIRALRPEFNSSDEDKTKEPELAGMIESVWTELEDSFSSALRGISLSTLCKRAQTEDVKSLSTPEAK